MKNADSNSITEQDLTELWETVTSWVLGLGLPSIAALVLVAVAYTTVQLTMLR